MDDAAWKNLEDLDRFHRRKGDYVEWMLSEERKHFAGNQKVRVVNSTNIEELCARAGLDLAKVQQAHNESLSTGDILFVTYEEDNGPTG